MHIVDDTVFFRCAVGNTLHVVRNRVDVHSTNLPISVIASSKAPQELALISGLPQLVLPQTLGLPGCRTSACVSIGGK